MSPPRRPAGLPVLPHRRLVSNRAPRRAEGFWITIIDPLVGRDAASLPLIHLQDRKKRAYVLTHQPRGRPGEWTRRFALDVAGPWTGIAVLNRTRGKTTGSAPPIRVLP